MMPSDEHRRCIAIGCPLHKHCAMPLNHDAKVKIWPPYMGKSCEHFVWRRDAESND